MKEYIVLVCGFIGGIVSTILGGWNHLMTTLVFAMGVDFATGLIVAGVFKQSKKTEHGALESNTGFKGLAKKGTMILIVLIAHRLDLAIGTGTNIVRDSVIIGFVVNELISVIENVGLMGVWVPPVLKKAIEVLKEKENK